MIQQTGPMILQTAESLILLRIKTKVSLKLTRDETQTLFGAVNGLMMINLQSLEEGGYSVDSLYSDIINLRDFADLLYLRLSGGKTGKFKIKTQVAISFLESLSQCNLNEISVFGLATLRSIEAEIHRQLQI